jgi:hypothetical protein
MPLSITNLAFFLQIEGGYVIHAFEGVQSIIMVPKDDEQPVALFHTSLQDFLTTQTHSQHFFIDLATSHLTIATHCLAVMTLHSGDIIYEIEMLHYAAQNWCHHLLSAVKEGEGGNCLHFQDDSFMNTLIEFVSGAFDPWINSIIFQVQTEKIVKMMKSLLQVGIMQHIFNIEKG